MGVWQEFGNFRRDLLRCNSQNRENECAKTMMMERAQMGAQYGADFPDRFLVGKPGESYTASAPYRRTYIEKDRSDKNA